MKNLLTNGIDRLQKINPDIEFDNSHFQKLISEEEIENYHFYKKDPESIKSIEIHPKDIVGTMHASYQGINWIEMLGGFTRSVKENYEETIEFIYSEKVPGKKAVSKYGDKYLIFCGNHRLCYAKLLNLKAIKVNVNEYYIDDYKYQLFQRFSKTGLKIDEKHFCKGECNFFLNNIKVMCNGYKDLERFIDIFNSVIIKESIINRKKLLRNSKLSKDTIFLTDPTDHQLLLKAIRKYKIQNL